MAVSKPSAYLNWTDGNPSKQVQPPAPILLQGWTSGEPPPFQYANWQIWLIDQWIQWLDQNQNSSASGTIVASSMRLINGGNWSWTLGTGTLAWASAFNLAIPSIPDADNQAAAGSIALTDGQIAYVTANIPFSVVCNTTSGSNVLTGVTEVQGIASGQTVTGTGIPGSTIVTGPPIEQADGTFNIPISANATANGTPTLTFSGLGALTVAAATSSGFIPGPTTVVIARRVGNNVYLGVNSIQMLLRDQELKAINDQGYLNVISVLAGENLTANQAVYISPGTGVDSGRTAGRAYKTDAGTTNGGVRSQFVGFVATTVLAGAAAVIVISGVMPGFTLTSGAIVYLDPATPGGLTQVRPTTSNLYLTPVGMAVSAAILDIAPTATSQIIAATGVGLGSADTVAINPATQSPYSITSGNNGQILLWNSANGAGQLNLPNPAISANLIFTFKDVGSQLNLNAATLHRFGSESIEQVASDFVMSANGGEWTFSCDGTNWIISAR